MGGDTCLGTRRLLRRPGEEESCPLANGIVNMEGQDRLSRRSQVVEYEIG
jgi:hypothetical protein